MSKLTKEQIEAFKKSQENPMFHGLTCMGYNGCKRSEQINDGLLIATEDGIKCPCGNYEQEYPDSLAPTVEEMDLPPLFCDLIKEQEENQDDYSPYCKICTGCGEEGCCSPLMCDMDKDGEYCEWYLRDLRFNYKLHEKFMEHIDKEKYPKLMEIYNKLYDEISDKYYK